MRRLLAPSPKQRIPPMWGNFIGHADDDLIAAAVLYANDCWELAHYHAQQAVEKYLKALAIAVADPDGTSRYEQHKSWCEGRRGHDLVKLAGRCAPADPFYTQSETMALLERVQAPSAGVRPRWLAGGPKAPTRSVDRSIPRLAVPRAVVTAAAR